MSSKTLPPGPKGFREMTGLISARKRDPLRFYRDLTGRYGKIVYLKAGKIANVFITDPDAIQKVLQTNAKNYVKGPGYERLRSFLGKGLLTSEGELWRRQRKLAAPAFHQDQMKLACKDIVDVGRELVERWERKLPTDPHLDLAAEMNAATLSVVSRTLFSSDAGGKSEQVTVAIQEAMRFSDAGGTAWLRIIDTLIPTREQNLAFKIERRLPLPRVRSFNRAIDTLRGVVAGIIENRRKTGDYGRDLLGALMHSRDQDDGSGMTDEQLRDEVMTIMNAGHETTATALSWTWLMLDKNPEIARRVREEVRDVLGDRDPAFDDLARLTYTHRVFEEAIRIYPPFWRISRRALADDELMGYHVPAGAVVVVSPYLTHRDPEIWENAEKFDPDRFEPEKSARRHRFSYIPFGAGQRLCIGSSFAFVEALAFLAMIVRRYQFTLIPDYRMEPEALITLRPKYGVPMRFARTGEAP